MRLCFLLAVAVCLLAQNDPVEQAIAAMQSGNLASAEQILNTELARHPKDPAALEVMGVVLDQEKKFQEAGDIYRRALTLNPRSPSLLNNYGNHLLSIGRTKEAKAAFAGLLVLQPKHPNASVQMARLSLDANLPADASRYLEHLPTEILDRPDVVLLRLRAAYALHQDAAGDELLTRISVAAHENAGQSLALGEALSAAGKHEKAEAFFARSLELQPDHFETLYDLGLAAAHAGHNDRAREVLEQALAKEPQNIGVLYDLAAVDLNLNRGETSLELLARARKLAPDRADIQLLLARTATQLGYFGDAAQAWEAYLKLKPGDAVAKREHAFAEMALSVNSAAALEDLQAYTRKLPTDPTGHYELAVAESPTDPEKAIPELTRALALKPNFAAAHLVRGLLLYRQGKIQLSLSDFEKAAAEDPANPAILERLGQNYLALGRAEDALRVLRQAEQIAPLNTGVLLQLGRALAKAGDDLESSKVFARYRELATSHQATPHAAGLVDFLSLSPTEQLARYRAGVERTVEKSPDNVEAQVRYLGLLLDDAKFTEAAQVSRKIDSLQADAAAISEASQMLLSAGQYADAKDMLRRAQQRGITSPGLQMDLAIAIDRVDGFAPALETLDHIDPSGRTGDYYLARAQFLEEAKRPDEADQALTAAFRTNPKRAELYQAAALSLLTQDRVPQALKVLAKAMENIPDNPQLQVMRAAAAALGGANSSAMFDQIENRWPEYSSAWIANACVMQASKKPEEAKRLLATARALGATGPAIEFCETERPLIEAVPVLFSR